MAFQQIFSYKNTDEIINEQSIKAPIDGKLLFIGKNNQQKNVKKEISKEDIVIVNNISYPIVADSNKLNVLAESIYIGNQYFLTILDTTLFHDICKYTNSYLLILNSNVKLRIIQMQKSSEVFDNSKCLVIFKIDYDLSNIIVKQDIINYNDFIYLERLGINCKIITDYSSLIHDKISNIIDNSILLSNLDKINQGSPLIINNKVIGLFYKTKSNNAYYLRLSRVTYWLCNFISIPYNTPINYSNQDLYNVIISLSDKVKELEIKLNESTLHNQFKKKIDPLILTLIDKKE